jgi:hypothetical protein
METDDRFSISRHSFPASPFVWNFGAIAWEWKIAADRHGWFLLVLLPWSLVGLFLPVVLAVSTGLVLDWIIDTALQRIRGASPRSPG